MNRKTGICILVCLVLLLLFGIWYQRRANQNTTHAETETVSQTEETIPTGSPTPAETYTYIVRMQDHALVVFLNDGQTVYMQTGIRAENLSPDMQKQAENGIGFSSQERLFDFLESYSS